MNAENMVIWAHGPWIMLECKFVINAKCVECGRSNICGEITAKPMRRIGVRCTQCKEVVARIHIENYRIFTESIHKNSIELGNIVVS